MIKKILLSLSSLVIFCCVTGFTTFEVSAVSKYETEPNNTKELAEEIKANNESPEDIILGNYANQFVVNGDTSLNDEDWFKVFLKAGQQTMTCNSGSFDFTVYDSNSSKIVQETFIRTGLDAKAFWVDIPTDGDYYIKIQGHLSSSTKYLFAIGSPTYHLDKVTISSVPSTITLTKSSKKQSAIFDTSLNSSIPQKAIVNEISMGGVRSSSASDIRVFYNSSKSLMLRNYVWSKDNLISMNMKARNKWKAEFFYQTNTTFQPKLTLRYVYPLQPTK